MMRKIARLLFTTTAVLIVSGCSISNLNYDNKHLTLQVDKKYLQLHGTLLKQHRDSFRSLYLTQKVLRLDEGDLVVYEDARTDMLYEFEPTTMRSIKVIFEAKSVIRVYAKSHLYAYQLILKDGRLLNIVAQQDDSQRLRFVYGLSTVQLNKMLKQLDLDARGAYYKQVIGIKDTHHAILSKWNVQKVHFEPLVVPLARMQGT